MNKEKVLNLANLARIRIADDEAEKLSHDFEAILNYVGEVKNATKDTNNSQPTTDSYALRNVMREDGEGHESGVYTERLLAEAPAREGDFIKVKKIL